MLKLIIDICEETYKHIRWLVNEDVGLCSPTDKTIAKGTPLEDYCLTQCEAGNPCLYCKHEFENKIIDKHIGDKCTADDCDEYKNNYDCISYLEEHERINSENEIGD